MGGHWGNAGSPSDGSPSKLCATLDSSRRLRMDGPNPGFFKQDRLRLGLAPTRFAALTGAVIAFDLGARAGAGTNFKLLGEKQIRATITGKDITDGARWSLYLHNSRRLHSARPYRHRRLADSADWLGIPRRFVPLESEQSAFDRGHGRHWLDCVPSNQLG